MLRDKTKKTPSWKRDNPPVSKLDAKELQEIRAYIKSKDFFFWRSKTKLFEIRKWVSSTYKKKIAMDQLKVIIKDECELFRKVRLRTPSPKTILLDGEGWYELSLAVDRVRKYSEHACGVLDVCLLVCSVEKVKCNTQLLEGMRRCHHWWER